MDPKFLNFLGIVRRAGKLTLGTDAVLDAARNQKAQLILLAEDLSKNTRKKIHNQTTVPVEQIPFTMDDIEFYIGKRTGVLSVNDKGFAEKILSDLRNVKK